MLIAEYYSVSFPAFVVFYYKNIPCFDFLIMITTYILDQLFLNNVINPHRSLIIVNLISWVRRHYRSGLLCYWLRRYHSVIMIPQAIS